MKKLPALPETICHGCGIRFVPKYPGKGLHRFHNQDCACRHSLARMAPDVRAAARKRGQDASALKAKRETETRWAAKARVILQRSLIDVRPDLALFELEPVMRAMAKTMRACYVAGYMAREQRVRRGDVQAKEATAA